MKKIISIFLTIVLLLSCVSFPIAIASEGDYIEIWNIEDLYNVRYAPDKNYILMTDIDFSQEVESGYLVDNAFWKPIDTFSGIFDGNKHCLIQLNDAPFIDDLCGKIKNLSIKNSVQESDTNGFFATTNNGIIEHCCIIGNRISVKEEYKNLNFPSKQIYIIGGFVSVNNGEILCSSNCNSDISLNIIFEWSSVAGGTFETYVGGICGKNNGRIEYCYNTGSIESTFIDKSSGYQTYNKKWVYTNAGGISGSSEESSVISNSYNAGTIQGNGYLPKLAWSNNYYAMLTENSGNGIALSNQAQISNCYTTTDSIVGSNCYKLSNDGEENSLSSVQMQQERYFVGFDFEKVWIIDNATEYKFPQLRNNRQDDEKMIDSIEFQTVPSVVTFRTEDDIKASGKLRVYYIDGSFEDMDITNDMLSGYDMRTTGKQTVTVTHRGFTLTYTITVTQRPDVIGISLLSVPDKTEFVKNTALDYTGGKVRILYKDGTTDTVDLTPENATGVDIAKTGSYTATFSYKGFSVDFSVTVVPVKIIKINILSLPDQVTYVEGQSIDRTGLSVEGIYNNGEKKLLTDYDLTYKNTAGKQTVTVSFSGIKATFTLTFTKRVLESISVLSDPAKTSYYTDEAFDPSGMTVCAFYNNGLSEEINDYSVSSIPDTTGMQMLEISYGGKSTYITITVSKRTLKSIKIANAPTKTKYNPGESFDKTGMTVNATYDNGTTKTVTDYTVSEILTDVNGSYVNITYGGFTCRQNIHVHSYVAEVIFPTCTAKGYTKHTCTGCGDTYNDSQINATGHNYGSWAKLNDTQHSRVCKNDGTHTETADHNWDSGKITTAVTCTTPGIKTYTCTVCKATKTESLKATGHFYGGWTRISDKEHQRICKNDNTHIERAHHNWDSGKITLAPTCTATGIKTFTCSVCNATRTEEVKATGHQAVIDPAVAATCTTVGKTEGSHCSVCGIILKAQAVISATGHHYGTWTNLNVTQHQRVCSNDPSHIEKANHAWDGGTVTKAPTTTTTGTKTFTCTVCNATRTETIEKLPEEKPIERYLLGDVDFDGSITAADARLALRASVGLETFNDKQTKAADADKDGNISAADARLILRCSVGLENLNE